MAGTSFSVDASAVRRLERAFGQLAPQVVQEEARVGVRRAGEIVRDAAITNINHKSGGLGRSGRVDVTLSGKMHEARVRFTAKYAQWVEKGRKGFSAVRAKALRFTIGGTVLFRKSVGPAPAQRFLARGVEQSRGQVSREMQQIGVRIARRVRASI